MEPTAAIQNILAAPTAQKERIVILDSLRGFAILGILLMNIGSFGMPGDPAVWNDTGRNFKAWYYIQLIPHGTQRALFSMLFGGGIILFIRSVQSKVEGIRAADYFSPFFKVVYKSNTKGCLLQATFYIIILIGLNKSISH